MFDTRKTLHDGGVLDVIKILATNRETGRLEIRAGKVEGAFFLKHGELVDARVGHLTGFQAINAVAAMRNARFNFDPSIAPPPVSSITPNERVVLKQFFGIDTVGPEEPQESPAYLSDEEVTIETSRIPVDSLPAPVPETLPDPVPETVPAPVLEATSSRSLYRGGLILAFLMILIAVAAVTLRNKYRERAQALPAAVATTTTTTEQPVAPAPVAVSEEVKTDDTPAPVHESAVARDLTGKWNLVNTVQKTSYRSFENMKIGFAVAISQNGKSFSGKGEKVSENGRNLPAGSRTPIQLQGSINGDRVEGTFFEQGTLRKTNGRFVWRIDKSGNLTGTFVTTAAGSSGSSAARKS